MTVKRYTTCKLNYSEVIKLDTAVKVFMYFSQHVLKRVSLGSKDKKKLNNPDALLMVLVMVSSCSLCL